MQQILQGQAAWCGEGGRYYSHMPVATPSGLHARPGQRMGAGLARCTWSPRRWRMLSSGFSAGLPLLLVFGTLSFWLREAGVDRSTIGFLSWVGLAYAFKWTWSPLVDRLPIPLLYPLAGAQAQLACGVAGGDRGWALLASP